MQKFRRLLFPGLTLCFLLLLTGWYLGRGSADGPVLRTQRAAAEVGTAEAATPRTLPAPEAPPAESGRRAAAPLDLNRATAEELEALPGIGEALARRILDYRAEQGPFRYTDDLLKVRGIGPATLAGLRDLICVEEYHEDSDH